MRKLIALSLCVFLYSCSDQTEVTTKLTEAVDKSATTQQKKASLISDVKAFKEGVHYIRLENPVDTGEQLTVTEFFWYGCSHCEKFEPYINAWNEQKMVGVIFRKVPAVWSAAMSFHAKIYYIAMGLERAQKLHGRLFEEVLKLRKERDVEKHTRRLGEVLGEYGLSAAQYQEQLKSPIIESKMRRAVELMKASGLTGTPAIMVNGKYRVISNAVKSYAEIIDIVNYLLVLEIEENVI